MTKMYYDKGSIYIEKDDQCVTCKNFTKGVACPLLHALGLGVVKLEGTMIVSDCGFYEEFKRHLRIVDIGKDAEKKSKKEE